MTIYRAAAVMAMFFISGCAMETSELIIDGKKPENMPAMEKKKPEAAETIKEAEKTLPAARRRLGISLMDAAHIIDEFIDVKRAMSDDGARRYYGESENHLMTMEVLGSQATIYLWIKVPGDGDDEAFAARLMQHGVVVSPGRMFGVDGAGHGYVRLALVPSLAEIHAACTLLRKVLA